MKSLVVGLVLLLGYTRKPKLTPHQQNEVAKMLAQGRPIRDIARHFNVGVATIDRIKNTNPPKP
ncbi:MAG: helix-turn-helix domain-containing protein [Geminicoccaceae bacterium]